MYRIVQEAMNNALKHSGARRIRISLVLEGNEAVFEVEDDGKGMSLVSQEGQGMGLNIMSYRAHLLGGTVDVRPGSPGTVVSGRIPLIT